MYTGFSEIYDRLMADVDYRSWAEFYARLMAECGIRGGRVCECACGTGSLTLPLQRMGFQMTGVDISQDMLWIAAQKAREAGAPIPFVRQDMRKLRLHRPMDAVLATCDGVNYLLEDKDVLAFFRAAHDALRPGGGLFFDVSTPWKLEHTLGDRTLFEDTPDVTYVWQNRWNARSQTVDMQLVFFVKKDDGNWRRIDETQRQRAHTRERLTELLHEAGFAHVVTVGNSRMQAPRPDEERWHLCAIRREDPEEETR